MHKEKYLKLLAVVFIITLLLFFAVRRAKDNNKQLKNSPKITSGVITSIQVHKGVYYAYYTFRKDSNIIEGYCRITDFKKEAILKIFSILDKKEIPVVYSYENAYNSKILFSKSDFNEYGIAVDSQFTPVIFSLDSLKNIYSDF
jgi:hypothetical protein